MSVRARRIRFWAILTLLLASLAAAGAGIYRIRQAGPASDLPLAPGRWRRKLLVMIRCRGDLKAGRSAQINTPVVPNLRISWMAPAGVQVKAGDPIIRFDSSSAQQTLAQKEDPSSRQDQASLDQAVAQARITAEQEQRPRPRPVQRRNGPTRGFQAGHRRQDRSPRKRRSISPWPNRHSKSRRRPSTCTPPPTGPRSAQRLPSARPRPRSTSISPGADRPRWKSVRPSPGS